MILPLIDPTAGIIAIQNERCAECPPECGICDAEGHCEDHCTEEDDYDDGDSWDKEHQENQDFAQDDCFHEPYDDFDF